MRNAFRTVSATALMTALLSGLPPVAFAAQARPAQQAQATPAPAPAPAAQQVFDERNAQQTRERLREVLSQYPPSVAQVLRLDPVAADARRLPGAVSRRWRRFWRSIRRSRTTRRASCHRATPEAAAT